MTKLYTISELAEELDATPRAIRFYEDKGLISPQRAGTTRVYTHRDRGRLILILRGKRLGFSLREIREWLTLYDADPDQVTQMKLLRGKIEERLEALEQQQRDLEETLVELREIKRQVDGHLDKTNKKAG
ncbi:MAG: MerR family DNA-binding transcriptional regulator [Limibacillus sp.]|jgi:DNA-binding transcriptional MerR regulator